MGGESSFWGDTIKTLGIAAPLVSLLIYLLKQATEERKEITGRFLVALQTTVEQSNEARIRAADELGQLVVAMKEHHKSSGEEHTRVVEAIHELILEGSHQGKGRSKS